MTMPTRWLDDDSAPNAVREVLRHGDRMDPPAGAQDAVWLALAGQIGAAGAATAAASGSAKAAAGASLKAATGAGASTVAASGGLIKAIVIGAISGVIAVSGYSALEPSPPEAPALPSTAAEPAPAPQKAPAALQGAAAPAPPPSTEPSSAPAPAGGAHEPAPGASAPAVAPAPDPASNAAPSETAGTVDPAVGAGAPLPGSAEERESRLREENALLGQARGALRSGDPGRAMQLLEQARQKFPGGVLSQEREALTIEALAKSGARDAASARAAAFIKAHPTSPHAARLQAFVLSAPAP